VTILLALTVLTLAVAACSEERKAPVAAPSQAAPEAEAVAETEKTDMAPESAVPVQETPGSETVEEAAQTDTALGSADPPEAKDPLDERMRELLEMEVEINFDETEMPMAVQFIEGFTRIRVVLSEEDLNADQNPVTLRVSGSLREGLDQICEQAGLAWKAERGIIWIGAPERIHGAKG
jgi:hypothetical protein